MPVKKGFVIVLMLLIALSLASCKKKEVYNFNFYDYMDTFISISVATESEARRDELKEDIKEIYRTYHELTNNYAPLSYDSGFKENLFSINQRINEDIEIDLELYEILNKAEVFKTLTNGYFDISIGKMVDIWKDVILDEQSGYMHNDIPKEVFDQIISDLEKINVIENPYTLSIVDNKYYVRLNHEDVKLDLGAISKGYATQLVYDYFIENGVDYFSISAGSSSISLGKKIDRKSEMFHISLANPVKTSNTYGMVYVQNKAINTSGNFEQYATYEGLRYHHVISPKTKLPAQYYHTVTILGDDAGLLDALSTALLSMPSDVFDTFMSQHQEEYNLEVIRFNYNETISTYLLDTVFEEF